MAAGMSSGAFRQICVRLAGFKNEIMSPEQHCMPVFRAQTIHHIGQSALRAAFLVGAVERENADVKALVQVRKFQGNRTQADAPAPCAAKEQIEAIVHVGFKVGWFGEAFGGMVFCPVIVSHA
ncbi:MAG: hypothetical protein QHJ82_16695, partial [Verrucomicrobiota bacterium]|nr:hypothetical protein [Verrucomicrobiota bacterium]